MQTLISQSFYLVYFIGYNSTTVVVVVYICKYPIKYYLDETAHDLESNFRARSLQNTPNFWVTKIVVVITNHD